MYIVHPNSKTPQGNRALLMVVTASGLDNDSSHNNHSQSIHGKHSSDFSEQQERFQYDSVGIVLMIMLLLTCMLLAI